MIIMRWLQKKCGGGIPSTLFEIFKNVKRHSMVLIFGVYFFAVFQVGGLLFYGPPCIGWLF